jgi:hypothetical protein
MSQVGGMNHPRKIYSIQLYWSRVHRFSHLATDIQTLGLGLGWIRISRESEIVVIGIGLTLVKHLHHGTPAGCYKDEVISKPCSSNKDSSYMAANS